MSLTVQMKNITPAVPAQKGGNPGPPPSPMLSAPKVQSFSSLCISVSSTIKPIKFLLQKMAVEMALLKPISKFSGVAPKFGKPAMKSRSNFFTIRMSSSSTSANPSKKTNKIAIKETLLTPRFYTTDFDEKEALFNTEINRKLNQAEFEALPQEFKTDHKQTHFVRNKEFKEAADKIDGPLRQIFVEFLERSFTAEFSCFLLYKELGRRLKVCACFLYLFLQNRIQLSTRHK